MKSLLYIVALLTISLLSTQAQAAVQHQMVCNFAAGKMRPLEIKHISDPNADVVIGDYLIFSIGVTSNCKQINGNLNLGGGANFYLGGIEDERSFSSKLYDMLMTAYLLNLPVKVTGEIVPAYNVSGYVGFVLTNSVQLNP